MAREAMRLYSVVDAAKQLGVSENYIYRRIRAGELRVVEMSNGDRHFQRVRADDLDAFVESRTFGRRAS